MIRFFRKIIERQKNKIARLLSSRDGQIAVILIFITAIALIFYAVTLNLGRVSENKTLTTLAANTSAAFMASGFTSYAEQLYQVQLGGENDKGAGDDLSVCGFTGVFAVLISIGLIVLSIFLPGVGAIILAHIWMLIVGLALAGLSLLLQLAVIQPGITALWNKLTQNLPIRDQFLERGIQIALQNTVTDPVEVEDTNDYDLDGLFGPNDKVNRFAVYYSERLRGIQGRDVSKVAAFQGALKGLLGGVYQPPDCSDPSTNPCCFDESDPGKIIPSECNPCCVDAKVQDIKGRSVRPACCDSIDPAVPYCGTALTCGEHPNDPFGTDFPFIYDPFYEDPGSSSIRNKLGRDDETPAYQTKFKKVHVSSTSPPPQSIDSQGIYRLNDTKGEVFPFLYMISEWGVDLEKDVGATFDPGKPTCQWFDKNTPGQGACNPPYNDPVDNDIIISNRPLGFPDQLALPNPPGSYNGSSRVDGLNQGTCNQSACVPDKLKNITTLFTNDENKCAEKEPDLPWKKGINRFCSNTWPYFACKRGTCTSGGEAVECSCGEPGAHPPKEFPEDALDDFIYGSGDFIQWAQAFLRSSPSALASNPEVWYPEATTWIVHNAADPDKNGVLWKWLDQFKKWNDTLDAWLKSDNSGMNCNQVWCVPDAAHKNGKPDNYIGTPADTCPGVKKAEADEFVKNGAQYGSPASVTQCLNYNTNNSAKFQNCHDSCAQANIAGAEANCQNLPRSLIHPDQDFDTNLFVVPKEADAAAFRKCLDDGCAVGNNFASLCAPQALGGPLREGPTPWYGPQRGGAVTLYPIDGQNPTGPDWTLSACQNSCTACVNSCGADNVCKANCSCGGFSCQGDILAGCNCLPNYDTCANACETNRTACINGCAGNGACLTGCRTTTESCRTVCYNDRETCLPGCSAYFTQLKNSYGVCWGWGAGNAYYDKVYDSWVLAQGDCVKEVPGHDGKTFSFFEPLLNKSAEEAKNQSAKFKVRADFITRIRNGAQDMYNIVHDFYIKLDAFLNGTNGLPGPAKDLIDAVADLRATASSTSLSSRVIYGWHSTTPGSSAPERWHLVRADTKVPGRCKGQCYRTGHPSVEPDLPYVKTYTRHWGIRRCYSLGDSFDKVSSCDEKSEYDDAEPCFQGGLVMTQVVKYDEDNDFILRFQNGIALWHARFFHPERGRGTQSDIDILSNQCPVLPKANGAFLLSERNSINQNCWDAANRLLSRGVATKTCAEYFFHNATPRGFSLKFVRCPNYVKIDNQD